MDQINWGRFLIDASGLPPVWASQALDFVLVGGFGSQSFRIWCVAWVKGKERKGKDLDLNKYII